METNGTAEQGFTLIELSIVLVVIGLLVGGVLVGQTLIKAAQIRDQVTQFEKFNQAVNTFRGKYDCLPGDCANATKFFPNLAYPYTNGDGNGLLNDTFANSPNTTGFPGSVENEPTLFWLHLWSAGLTKCCNPTQGSYIIGKTFPQDKVNGGASGVGVLGGKNGYFWGINQNSTVCCPNGSNPQNFLLLSNPSSGVVTPAQAQAFDTKVDDGLATTGNVYAAFEFNDGDLMVHPQAAWASFTPAQGNNCLANTSPPTYNLSIGSTGCSLWINMQGM